MAEYTFPMIDYPSFAPARKLAPPRRVVCVPMGLDDMKHIESYISLVPTFQIENLAIK